MQPYPTTILLATDGSTDARLAERVAIDLCARSGAQIHIVHAWIYVPTGPYPYSGMAAGETHRRVRADAEAVLAESAERVARAGGTVAGQHLRLGSPAGEIVALGEAIDADLVLLGSRGLGTIRRLVLGSVSEAVAHAAHRPTLIVRCGERAWPPARIVIGDDGSADATRAADLGLAFGRLYGADVTLARAIRELPGVRWDAPGQRAALEELHDEEDARARDVLETAARRLAREGGPVPGVAVVGGGAAAVLLAIAEGEPAPALIAVGCRGLGPLRRLRLGSVSTTLLHAARGPILIVPHRPEYSPPARPGAEGDGLGRSGPSEIGGTR